MPLVFISGAVSLFVITFLVQAVRVEGTAMAPTLEGQDRLIVNKLVYQLCEPRRGEIVMLLYPLNPDRILSNASSPRRAIGYASSTPAFTINDVCALAVLESVNDGGLARFCESRGARLRPSGYGSPAFAFGLRRGSLRLACRAEAHA